MTIWILALIVMASTVGMGLRQGAIRAAFTFVGLVIAAALATPIAHLVRPLLAFVVSNPLFVWFGATVIVFAVILATFKIAGNVVHKKVDVYYKYKAGDLRLALWERLNERVGAAVGVLNGTVYLILITFAIYAIGYSTIQLASNDDPRWLKLINRVGNDLERSGFVKSAAAVSKLPASYFEAADIAGLVYRTPRLKARLTSYPGVITIAERNEFQDLGADAEFPKLFDSQRPVTEIMKYPAVAQLTRTKGVLKNLWSTIKPDLADLRGYLETGRSAKYEAEPILGRWTFDANGAVNAMRKSRPNLTPLEAQRAKRWMMTAYANTTFSAGPSKVAVIRNYPRTRVTPGTPPTTEYVRVAGTWDNLGSRYIVKFDNETITAEMEGDRLTLVSTNLGGFGFIREN